MHLALRLGDAFGDIGHQAQLEHVSVPVKMDMSCMSCRLGLSCQMGLVNTWMGCTEQYYGSFGC